MEAPVKRSTGEPMPVCNADGKQIGYAQDPEIGVRTLGFVA